MKTGCHKKYPVFLQLLQAAFNKSATVSFEILTFQDLENLKQQKSSQSSNQSSKNNKRYLIINYQNEFDKVHYPLTLNQTVEIDQLKLKNTIQRLKKEINEAKSSEFSNSRDSFHTSSQVDQLRAENELLRERMKQLDEGFVQKKGAIETDNLIRDKQQKELELENEKKDLANTIKKLTTSLQSKEKELWMRITELNGFKKELSQLIGKQDIDQKIQQHVQQMNFEEENEISQARKAYDKLEKELDKVNIEIEQYKKLDQKQKQRIKQLETEFEQSLRKFTHKSDRGYSPYSNASNKAYSRNSPNSSKNSFNSKNSSNSVITIDLIGIGTCNEKQIAGILQKTNFQAYCQSVICSSQINYQQVTNIIQIIWTPPNRVPVTNKNSIVQRNYSQNQKAPPFQRKQSPTPNPEFRDNHFQVSGSNVNKNFKSNELDQKINNLRNLLSKAKK